MKRDVIALGELLIDFTPIPPEDGKPRFEQNAGGAPMNVLAAVARLGLNTGFIGCVGEDQFGRFLMDFLDQQGIDNRGVQVIDTHHTTLAFVHLDEKGEREFTFYRKHGADLMLREDDVTEDLFEGVKIFHFGSLSLTAEPSRTATYRAIESAIKNGCMISFDPNLRPPLWGSLEQAKEEILSVLEHVDVLKLSEEELEFISGNDNDTAQEDIRKAAQLDQRKDVRTEARQELRKSIEESTKEIYQQYGIELIIVTLGSEGCAIRRGEDFGIVEGIKVKAVDTTGAGDAHLGAMLYKVLLQERSEESTADFPKNIPFRKLMEFGNFANLYAAYVTTKFGSAQVMPDFETVKEFWEERNQ